MNHYPRHIGDFNNATRHLTRLERSIYSDLLDLYYETERPLMLDVGRLARRIIATSQEERDALDAVLGEFFVLEDDGFHNKRCDEEIASYQERKSAVDDRDNNEYDRKKRHNEKRKALFAELRELGGSAPWDANLEQLKSLISSIKENQGRTKDAPRTEPERTGNGVNQNQNQNQNQYNPPTPQGGDEDEIPADWKADTRTMRAMPLDWTPDTNTLNTYLQGKAANGRPVTVADVTARLGDWRENANASGKVMTDAQWTLLLIKYVMTCLTNGSPAPANRRVSAPQVDPLAFTEENRPERGPYALFKPGPKKTPMTDEGRAMVEQLRRQAFGDAA